MKLLTLSQPIWPFFLLNIWTSSPILRAFIDIVLPSLVLTLLWPGKQPPLLPPLLVWFITLLTICVGIPVCFVTSSATYSTLGAYNAYITMSLVTLYITEGPFPGGLGGSNSCSTIYSNNLIKNIMSACTSSWLSVKNMIFLSLLFSSNPSYLFMFSISFSLKNSAFYFSYFFPLWMFHMVIATIILSLNA